MASDILTAHQPSAAPVADPEDARRIARQMFGLTVEAAVLDGEIDRNFRLRDAAGGLSVLKLSHAGERAALEFQNAVLGHVAAAAPACVVPRVMKGLDGGGLASVPDAAGRPCYARLLTYVGGRPLHALALELRHYRHLGQAIARLNEALSGCPAPALARPILWDLRAGERIRALLPHIAGRQDRAEAEAALLRLQARHETFLSLRHQVIHHDLNPHNLIATEAGEDPSFGFIDFGDAMVAPLICELAVAAAYHVGLTGDPLARIREIVAGYDSVLPLQPAERDILPTLIAARLAQSLAISNWRAALSPPNGPYLLRYAATNSRALARLNREIDRPSGPVG